MLWKNLVPGGRFEVSYAFKPTPFISALRPAERLTKFEEGREQSIIGDPVYFDVRLPSSFEDIEIVLEHKNPTGQKFTFGSFIDRAAWKFRNADLFITDNGDGFFVARAKLRTEGLDIMQRTITFVFGAPDASILNPITVYKISVFATKKPLKFAEAPFYLFVKLLHKISLIRNF